MSEAQDAAGTEQAPVHAVKFADGTDNIIEGLAVPFGGPFAGKDLDGESFGPDTDLALEWFPEEGRPVIFHHGLDEGIKTALVGRQIAREVTNIGHWVKVQLDKRNRYFEAISQMVNDGLLSFSSGSIPHLVQTDEGGSIKAWPWVELSLTPTPANPYASVYAVKLTDAIEHIASIPGTAVPPALKAAVDAIEDGFTEQTPGDSEPEPLADHSERVSREVKAWVERLTTRVQARTQEGRKTLLSDPTVEFVRVVHADLGALIEQADRPSVEEAEAARALLELELALTA